MIDPALQDRLYQASPYNVDSARAEPAGAERLGDRESLYAGPQAFLRGWLRQGVLRTENHPAFYLYEQTFDVEGQTHTREGFSGPRPARAVRARAIFPHEQTLAGPKADRLALYQATGFNLSPIFGLYPDANHEVIRLLEAGLRDRTPLEATDHLGVVNRLWLVATIWLQTAVQGLMARSRSSSPTGTIVTRPV